MKKHFLESTVALGLTIFLITTVAHGQTAAYKRKYLSHGPKDSAAVNAYNIYDSIASSKPQSIFKSVWNGKFKGLTTGFIQILDNSDTLTLNFQSCKTKLKCLMDNNDSLNSTKIYSTKTTDGKTSLVYQTYPYRNILVIILNGNYYYTYYTSSSGLNLSFDFFHDKNLEYLKLNATKSMQLKNTMQTLQGITGDWEEADKLAKSITVLSGSTIIMTMKK